MGTKKDEHWAFEALRKRLAETTQVLEEPPSQQVDREPRILGKIRHADWEGGTIFLFDPELREELDEILAYSLYPKILNEFEDQPFSIPEFEKIELNSLRTGIEGARSALFLMTDPARPVVSSQRPWWHIRFNLESKTNRYMLRTELLLSLPFSIEPDWILDFLTDSKNWRIPPSLSVDHDEFVLSFSWGEGRSLLLAEEEWTARLTEPFRKHIAIAKEIDRFSVQPNNRLLKSNMLHVITDMYGG